LSKIKKLHLPSKQKPNRTSLDSSGFYQKNNDFAEKNAGTRGKIFRIDSPPKSLIRPQTYLEFLIKIINMFNDFCHNLFFLFIKHGFVFFKKIVSFCINGDNQWAELLDTHHPHGFGHA